MRVRELATDLRVNADVLLRFLRESGVRVGHADAFIRDTDVAKVRTRLERERRAGHGEAADVMSAVVKAHKPTSRRRRRRRRVVTPEPSVTTEAPPEEAVAVDGEAAPETDGTAAPEVTADVDAADGQVEAAPPVEEAGPTDAAAPAAPVESEVEDAVVATPPVEEAAPPEPAAEPPLTPSVATDAPPLETAIPPIAAQAPGVEAEPEPGAAERSPIMPARTGQVRVAPGFDGQYGSSSLTGR